MSDGKIEIMVWEPTITFRGEVGFALSFVGPVYHQVPIATETVGDFICENKEKTKRKHEIERFSHGCSCKMYVKECMQSCFLFFALFLLQ